MKRIILAGAGQIGSRHLQGLLKSTFDLEIEVAEPSESSRNQCKERVSQIISTGKKEISYKSSVDDLSGKPADIAIIATNSDTRAGVVKSILSKIPVKFLILEKVVYQSISDFDNQLNLINSCGSKAWVNCPRRVYPFYMSLKDEISKVEDLYMTVSGSNWGLGCNALHFIDLYDYYTGSVTEGKLMTSFDKGIIESKRAGYSEFTGDISIVNEKGKLMLRSFRNQNIPVLIDLSFPGRRYIINELAGKVVTYSEKSSYTAEILDIPFPFQSSLTGFYVDDLLNSGTCGLTPLDVSKGHHKVLFNAIGKHIYDESGHYPEKFPVT